METFMSEAIILEALLASCLLALWITWLALRGLFLLMPAKTQIVPPVRSLPNRPPMPRRRDAA
jgi:hypothetical protein